MTTPTINLKVLSWNVENLFLLSDEELTSEHLKLDEIQWQKLSTSVYPNKSLQKTKALADVINSENPDVIILCEVGGLESLQNFNRLFLGDKYSAALVEGNSDRNIDVGFLVRKNMGFYFDIRTNKTRLINYLYPHERDLPDLGYQSHRFSRDAAELHLFLQDQNQPFLVIVGTHLKSQLDRDRIDPNGFERRQAEFQTLLKICSELRAKHSPAVPILVAGDFNGNAGKSQTDAEFVGLYDQDIMTDVCEIAGLPAENRPTYYQIGRSGRSDGKQIDFCFLTPEAYPYLRKESVRIYRFLDPMGFPLPTPTTLEAKGQLPSDHYPVVFELHSVPLR